MKHFLPNLRILRNVCFIVCVSIAAAILFFGVKEFASALLTLERSYTSVYAALKTSLVYNTVGGILLGISILLYAAPIPSKVSFCAVAGICGMLSFICYGLLSLFYGFIVGEYLSALGLFLLTGYANVALLIGTRAYNCYLWDKAADKNAKPQEKVPEYDAPFIGQAV